MRRTRIVATIGPASDSPATLDALIAAGVDVARLNASHGTREELQRRFTAVREASARAGAHVAVLLDLAGPKLRIGAMAENAVLEQGREFALVTGECEGDRQHACVTYAGLVRDVHPGDRLLLDDGRIELKVRAVEDSTIATEVQIGGLLKSRKGLNVPGVTLGVDPITEKDLADLAWGLEAGVDLVAQSFVRNPDDIARLREHMGPRPVPIIAKVEKHEAVSQMEAVVAEADAIMVARGDLGVETSPETVPVVQKRLVEECRAAGKPVIIATQMLESMVRSTRPTRAEANDVANGIFAGVDAVMLSEETAAGEYPVEAVRTMSRIALAAEESMDGHFDVGGPWPWRRGDVTEAVSAAVVSLAEDLRCKAIVTATQSGATAMHVARHRPAIPVVAATPDPAVARRLKLVWGVIPIVVPRPDSSDEMLDVAVEALRQANLGDSGDLIALTAGVAVNIPGGTNLIRVHRMV